MPSGRPAGTAAGDQDAGATTIRRTLAGLGEVGRTPGRTTSWEGVAATASNAWVDLVCDGPIAGPWSCDDRAAARALRAPGHAGSRRRGPGRSSPGHATRSVSGAQDPLGAWLARSGPAAGRGPDSPRPGTAPRPPARPGGLLRW